MELLCFWWVKKLQYFCEMRKVCPIDLTLCMDLKNEKANLSRTLDSVKGVVDEMVAVDTGSESHP